MTLTLIDTKTFSLPAHESDPEVLSALLPYVGMSQQELEQAYFEAVNGEPDDPSVDTIASILLADFDIVADFHEYAEEMRLYPCSFTPISWSR
jgi:hypothetical protein